MATNASPLIVHSANPFNAEPPLDALRRSFVTPQELFYVRTHGTVPTIDATDYRLCVAGNIPTPLTLTLADVQANFANVTVTSTLQCAGNRRADMTLVRPVSGDPWQAGAIGNAAWSGVKLGDVLDTAGVRSDAEGYVEFVSCDDVEIKGERFHYTVSIPMSKARSPEVILAWQMNGSALTPEHGFPLRAVVPGYAGVRSVKWLVGINVLDEASTGYIQQKDYKFFPPDSREEDADWVHAMTINKLPLNAAICEPEPYAQLPAGPCAIRGYAVASNAASIARVDVSFDGGRTWHQADLETHADKPWSWTLWNITLDLPTGEHELAVRAWDDAGQTQPPLADDSWNFKGYLNASWHRFCVRTT